MARQAEVFEIRTLLSGITFVVNTMNDTVDDNIGNGTAADAAGNTSLRAAIQEANATSDDVTIVLPAGTFSLSLSGAGEDLAASGDLDITNTSHSIQIRGVGESGTTIDGVGLDRVFDVALGAEFSLSDVTVTGGSVANDGGGLRSDGFVTIARSTFTNNATTASGVGTGGGAISVGSSGDVSIFGSVFLLNSSNASSGGGAILNNGRVFVDGTTFDSNTAGPNTQSRGGAIANSGDLTVDRSLFDSNTSAHVGGAIANDTGTVFVANSTFDGNMSGQAGGAIYENGSTMGSTTLQSVTITQNTATLGGGGVRQNSGTVFVQNSVIAGNTGSSNDDVQEVGAGTIVSNGNNFIGERDGTTGFTDGVNGDQVGTAASPKDPQLASLADNGGPTLTRVPVPGSPLIDMGSVPPVISPITFFPSDQRGATRQSGIAVDIGAVETGFTGFFVNTLADTPDASPVDGKPEDAAGNVSLRSVVQHVNGGEDIGAVVVLSPEVYSLTRTGIDDSSLNGDLDTQNNMRFSGFGSLATAIDGQNQNRIFHVFSNAPVFNDLTLRNGNATGDPFDAGGALLNASGGSVTLSGVTVRDSTAALGGGIYSAVMTTIEGSTITGNSATTSGGGLVASFGTTTIRESFISNNSAGVSAGGIGISGDADISSTTVRDNTSMGQAGGIGVQTSATVTLTDSMIRSNSATTDAGGIGTEGFLTILGGEITQNTAGGTGAGIGAQVGTLTVVGTQLTQNIATGDGGGLALQAGITADIRFADFGGNQAANGGGIANTGGNVSLFGVTIADGNATTGAGIAQLSGSTTITNSTISGNTAIGPGGGLYKTSGTLNVRSSTITQNAAATGGGFQLGSGGGTATVGNTIVAGNTATMSDADVAASFGGVNSNGFNLIGAGGVGFTAGINDDIVGTPGAPINAMLGVLLDNGGGTRTHALLAGSPAIDSGDNAEASRITDQRGAPRQLNGGTSLTVDIGAFENGFNGFFVDTTADTVDANPGNGVAEDAQGNTSLRAAIQEANALSGTQTIILPAGTYALSLFGADEDLAASGDLDITDDLIIQGQGFDATRIDGLQQDRVFDIDQKTVTINDLQITNGDTAGQTNAEGGGLRMVESSVTLNRIQFSNNSTPDRGGAIFDLKFGPPATLIINDSHFINSQAADGGAIHVINDVVDINNTLIENSQANTGSGGAIHSRDGQVTITGSEIRLSQALSGKGGAIFSDKQGGGFGPGFVSVVDSRITNSQADSGGAIHGNGDDLTITGSEITFNMTVTGDGGAIENVGGNLQITESLIENNQIGGTSARGGAVATSGPGSTLTITDSLIRNNNGGIGDGGGVFSDSIGSITGSTISGNFAGSGGGVRNDGMLTIQNSTISGNMATGGQPYGGGIYGRSGSTTTIESSTITNNAGYGGGIYAGDSTTLNLKNTIIAGNSDPFNGTADLTGAGTVNSNGNNILGDTFGSSGLSNGVNGDIVGGETSVAVSNATNAAPIQVTASGHGLSTGDRVRIAGVAGNTAANGTFTVTVIDANDFTLDGSFGNGTYITGGSVFALVDPQLAPLAVNLPPESAPMQEPQQTGILPGPVPEIFAVPEVETLTHLLLPSSVAIDTGNNTGAPATDQRGLPRPTDGDGNMTATVDIGAIELFFGSASGIVFDDVNGNGNQEMGEPGIPGVTVFHDANENGIPDPGEPTISTLFDDPGTMGIDETGTFVLGQIPPGPALIRHQVAPGHRLTAPVNAQFGAPQSVGSVTNPGESIAVDVNNDGNLDAIATRPTANEITVSFGDGNGGFSAPMSVAVGTNPVAVGASDFDFDGQPDLFVANKDSNDVSILLNVGGGMFASAMNFSVGTTPQAVTQGDFNGDMNVDIAVANGGSDSVTILTGDGMGGFGMLTSISVGDNPSDIATFDINGDSTFELATVNRDDGTVTVIEFVNGAVNTTSSSTTVTQPFRVAATDINHDGLEDLAIVGATGDVKYRLSQGASLGSDITAGSVTNPTDLVAADFNGNRFQGFAVSSDLASGVVTVFENANGVIQPGVAFSTGDNPQAIDAVDTNFDGLPDLFTANAGSGDFSALVNVTGAQVATVTTNAVASGADFGVQQLGSIVGKKFSDLNLDGIHQQNTLGFFDDFNSGSPDINWANEVGNWQVVNGEYSAATPNNNPLTYNSLPFALTDFEVEFDINNVTDGGVFLRSTPPIPGSSDLNGVLLVALGPTSNDLYWHIVQNGNPGALLNPVGGLFNAGDDIHLRVVVQGTTYSVFLNGSTTPATTLDTGLFGAGQFALYSNSNQTFDNISVSDVPNPEPGIAGVEVFIDENANGRRDPFELATLTQPDDPGTVEVDETGNYEFVDVVPGEHRVIEQVPSGFLQTFPGGPEFDAETVATTAGSGVDIVQVDFNGDGILDLVTLSDEISSGTLRSFRGNGAGGFSFTDMASVGSFPDDLVAGDLDGDSLPDLVVSNSGDDTVQVFELQANGTFSSQGTLATPRDPRTIRLADVDGDMDSDIVVANFGSAGGTQAVSVFTNNGGFTFSAPTHVNTVGSVSGIDLADLDHDGDLDLVAANADRDEFKLFRNDSGSFVEQATVGTGDMPVAVEIRDLSHDGLPDIIVAVAGASPAIHIHFATDIFAYPAGGLSIPTLSSPLELAIADFDENGELDIATTDSGRGEVSVFAGMGDGMFAPSIGFSLGTTPSGLATGDADGDGRTDLLVAGGASATFSVFYNRIGTHGVFVTSGLPTGGIDFGNIELATISGTKFHDLDQNGVQDMGEPGLPGFTIYIDDNENGRLDPGEMSAVTDEDGMFTIGGVRPVEPVRVREVQQPGFNQTEPSAFTLDTPISLPVNGGARSFNIGDVIASGDFDGDGLAEIVSANPGADSVSVVGFEGAGIPKRIDLAVGMTPLTVRVADLNADGNLDIVTANNGSDDVSVILGNGDGTFQASSQFAAGTRPQSLTIADVDGGGTPDVVVSSDSSSNLQVLSNNGAGVLAAPVAVPVAGVSSGEDIESGDFDMDGDIDLAVVSAVQNRVSILLNAGGGTFGAATPVAVGMFPLGTAIGDFDEDGDLDLTVTNTSDSTIQLLTNDGTGTFSPGAVTAVGGSPEAVVVGDVNNDGHLDVVAANQVQSDVNILLGDGMGGFTVGSGMIGASQDGVALDDLNGDGRLDILTETFGLGSVTALLNLTGTRIATPSAGEMVSGVDFGNFALPGEISGTKYDDLNENGVRDMGEPGLPGFTIFLDLDNDDVLDGGEPMTVTSADGSFTFTGVNPLQNYTVSEVQQPGFVQLAPNTPGFAFSGDVLAGASAAGIVTGDFDGQFGEDMAVTLESSNQVAVILRQANGTFGAPTLVGVGNQPFTIVAADFDGANGLDLAVANEADSTVTILTNNGSGVFSPQSPVAVSSSPADLSVADVDGMDGPDLVIANNSNNSFQVALNDGMGTLTAQTPVGVGIAPSSVAVADYDGDGDQDVAVTTSADNRLTVFLQTSPLVFDGQAPIVTGADPSRLRSADLNGDLVPDLVVVNQQSGDVTVVLNNSSGGTLNLAPPVNFLTGVAGESLALVDLTRDGAPEIVVTGEDDEQLAVLNNDGLGGFSPPSLFPLDGTFPVEVAPIQLNADGDFDLVLTDAEFGEITLLTSTVGSHSIFVGAGATVSGLEFGNREINDPPTVTAPPTASIAEDTSLTFGMNAISISDPDAGANNVEVVLTATNGTATLSQTTGLMFSSGSNGSSAMTFTGTIANINAALNDLVFDPTANFNGAAFLNVSADDLGNTGFGGPQFDSAQVAITVNAVNDAPMLTVPGGVTLNEDGSIVLGAITVADDDIGAGNAEVTLSVSSGILTLPSTAGLSFSMGSNGSPSMTFSGNLGNVNTAINGITYVPNPDFNGADTLSVSVSDLGNTGGPPQVDSDVISITVDPINDAPIAIVPGAQSATEDTSKLINGLSVIDVDAATNDVRATLTASNGTITVDASVPSGLQAGDITGNGTSSVVLNGTVMEINLTLGVGITYQGNLNFAGTDTVAILIEDLGSTGETPVNPLQDSDSFDVNVSAVNDAPVLNGVPVPLLDYTENDTATVLASTVIITDVDDSQLASATVDFTANFQMLEDVLAADVSGTSIDVSFDSETGVLLLTGADSLANYQQVLRTVTYQNTSEDPSQLRRTVRFVVNDGSASSAPQLRDIDVTSVNDAPTFDSQATSFVLAEHSMAGTAVHTVLASDVDSPAFLTFSIVSGNTGNAFAIDSVTGQITVSDPSAVDFEGVGTFNLLVRVTDANPITPTPLSADQTFTINLTDIAEPFNVGPGAFSTGAVTLVRDGAFLHARLTGTMTDAVPRAAFANVTDVFVTARDGGSDELTVDLSGGDPIPSGGVFYDGGSGAGTDSLVLTGGTVGTVNHTLQDPNSGTIDIDGDGLVYTGLEPVTDLLIAANRAFFYDAGDDIVTLSDGLAPADGRSRLTAPSAETVDFRNPTSTLLVSLGAGDDIFRTVSTDSTLDATVAVIGEAGADDISAIGFTAGGLTIDGGDDNDVLGGSPGQDDISGGNGDDLFVSSPGNDMMDGGAGNDRLNDEIDDGDDNFNGGAGFDLVRLTSPSVNSVTADVGGADSAMLAATSPMGTSTVDISATESLEVTSTILQDLSVDYSTILTDTNLSLTEGEGDFQLSGMGLINVTAFSIGDDLNITGSRGADTISVTGLSSFDAGLNIQGSDGIDLVVVPAGLPGAGLDGDIVFGTELIDIAGTLKSNGGQVQLDGMVSLTGDATLDATSAVLNGDVMTGVNTLTVEGDTQLNGTTSIFSGTFQLNGDLSSNTSAVFQGPTFNVTGNSVFLGRLTQAGSTTFGGTATFAAPVMIGGTINGGSGTFRFQAPTELGGGTINTTGLIEVGVIPPAGQGAPPSLSGEGTVTANNLLILDGSVLAPQPVIQTSATQLQAGSIFNLTDLNKGQPPTPTQLVATGSLNLGGTTLFREEADSLPFVSQLIINKTSAGPIAGTFDGLPEGAAFAVNVLDAEIQGPSVPVDIRRYAITYQGGDGNDVEIIPVSSISGLVFEDDSPENGTRETDPAEARVQGVVVELLDDQGAMLRQTTTAADGTYTFADLLAGNYRVRFTAPDSQHFADRNVGMDDTIDSDPNVLTGEVLVPNLMGGEDRQNVDAGLIDTTISISDPAPINEGNGNPVSLLTFEVTLNGRSPHQVTVNALVAAAIDQEIDPATIGQDVTPFQTPGGLLPVVFNPGQTTQTVTVSIVGDLNLEPDEGFEVRLNNPVQAALADDVALGIIRNDDFAAPTIVFGNDASIIEGQFPSEPLLELTINLEGGTVNEDLFISYNSIDPLTTPQGVATPGVDFRAVDDVAVIPAGLESVTIQIPIIGDADFEPDETFDVELTDIDGGEMQEVSFGGRTVARGTITNDDVFVPEVSIGDAFVSERNSPATSTLLFPVTLSGPAATDTRITFSTTQLSGDGTATEGLDYLPAGAEPLFIPQGQVSRTIAVTVLGDQIDEDDEVLAVELGDILEGNVTIAEPLAVGTIGDDDDPILLASLEPEVTVTEGPDGIRTSFTMTLNLSGDALVPVDLLVSTLPPDPAAINAATPEVDFVSFTDRRVRVEAGRRTATFNVEVLGDAIFEPDEFLLTQITGIAPGTPPNILIDAQRNTATGTITDDDAPTPIASIDAEASTTETRPGLTTVVSIPVRLSSPSMETVTVDFETVPSVAGVGIASDFDDPSTPDREDDFRARTDSLTFAPGQQLQFIQILVNGDDLVEPPETFAVDLTGISSNAELDAIATRNVSTIFDDDVAIPFVSIDASARVTEPDGNGVIPVDLTVTLSGRVSQDVVVGYSIPNVTTPGAATAVSDYVPVAGDEVTIAAGQTSATLTVLVTGDNVAENEERFFVQLDDVASLPDGTVIAQLDQQNQQTEITIDDNDAAVPTIQISDATVFEGDPVAADGVAPVDDPRLDFTISLSSVPTGPVSVEVETVRFENAVPGVANTDGPNRDVFATRRILFFDATITSQTFSVRVEPDFQFEADELVFIRAFNPIGAILSPEIQGVGTVANDDVDRPTVSISSVSLLEGDVPGENIAVLEVTLDADPAQGTIPDVSVGFRTLPITATENVDYTPINGELTFAEGVRTQTIEIPIIGDLDNEGPEEFFVELFDLDDGIQDVELNREAFQGIVTIRNDDAPEVRFQIDDVRQREGTGGTTEFVFTVRRTGNSAQASTVQFATSAGTAEAGDDFVGRSGTLSFAADGPDTQTVTITVVSDDRLEEEFETFFVTLSNPTNASIVAGAGQGTGTILDDDQRVFSADANAALEEIARELRERFAGAALDDPAVPAFFEERLLAFADEFGIAILGIIMDPVDFLLTDLESRTVGYTEADGEISEIPRAFYSGDGDVELVVIPAAEQGVYGLQLSGVDTGEFRSTATLVTADGFTKTISNVDTLTGDVELALDFTEEDALPLRGQVAQELANRQQPSQQPVQNNDNLAIADDVAAAIDDVVLPEDLLAEPPPDDGKGPIDRVIGPIGELLRDLGDSLTSQMDPLPELTPEDPDTAKLLDEVYSGLGHQAFGAPGDLLLDLIDLLTDFGEDDDSESESEGEDEATDQNGDENNSETNDGSAALDRLFESRKIAKAQREALLWLEQRRKAEADDAAQTESNDDSPSRRASEEPQAEANSPAQTTASVKRNPDSRGDADSEEIPEEEA